MIDDATTRWASGVIATLERATWWWALGHSLATAGGLFVAYRVGDAAGWDMSWHEEHAGEQRVCVWRPGRGEPYRAGAVGGCDCVDDEPDDGVDERSLEVCPSCGATEPDDCHCGDVEVACVRDDSTECDCPRCVGAEDRFWREQGEQP